MVEKLKLAAIWSQQLSIKDDNYARWSSTRPWNQPLKSLKIIYGHSFRESTLGSVRTLGEDKGSRIMSGRGGKVGEDANLDLNLELITTIK
jgi:hypothetical protein